MRSLGSFRRAIVIVAAVLATGAVSNEASAQQRKFSFGYDQPHTTGYGIAADIFNAKLMELSGGLCSVTRTTPSSCVDSTNWVAIELARLLAVKPGLHRSCTGPQRLESTGSLDTRERAR